MLQYTKDEDLHANCRQDTFSVLNQQLPHLAIYIKDLVLNW